MKKKQIGLVDVNEFRAHQTDTGSTGFQMAGLTNRIYQMDQHLRTHKKDVPVKRRIKMLVEKRRKLLRYLERTSPEAVSDLKQRLNIRN